MSSTYVDGPLLIGGSNRGLSSASCNYRILTFFSSSPCRTLDSPWIRHCLFTLILLTSLNFLETSDHASLIQAFEYKPKQCAKTNCELNSKGIVGCKSNVLSFKYFKTTCNICFKQYLCNQNKISHFHIHQIKQCLSHTDRQKMKKTVQFDAI